jgi:oxygen-independent coproporphyrinogen-3 oxidase
MYDLPQQSLADWEHTLDKVKTLPITHLSLYNLTIEPHTLFFKKKKELVPLLPNEEISLAMYQMAIDKIESMGLQQYEISAFAKPGYESLHNSGYWIGRPFLGFGPSAFSFWEGKRFQNVPHLKKYCDALKKGESPIHFEEALDLEALRRELFVIQLRLRKGVYLKKFSEEQGELNQTTLDQLHSLSLQGLIQWEGDLVSLSKKGVLFYDTIASELI